MNRKRLSALADAIEAGRPDLGFTMRVYGEKNACGTDGCIAGWAVAIWEPKLWQDFLERGYVPGDKYIPDVAQELLGLDYAESSELFAPHRYQEKSQDEAVATLRRAAQQGVIEW